MLALQPAPVRATILKRLNDAQAAALRWDWSFFGRPEQFAPPGDWSVWLVLAGRGFGKTRTGAEWIRQEVAAGRALRIAMIAETAADARDVMVEGPSGILAVSPPGERPVYESSKRRLTWASGAQATLFNATEPDQLRGPQFDCFWADELAKWRYATATWDQLQFGLRELGSPRGIVTTTPRPIKIMRDLIASEDCVVTRGRTEDNAENLAIKFLKTITDRYGGTRLGRQELNAEILDDVPGALWTRTMIDAARNAVEVPQMARVVVAVDPSGARSADDEGRDAIGIVVAGRGVDGRGYVLADRSCRLSPAGWGRRACDAYWEFRADRIVAETNFGGAMVEHVVRTADSRVAYQEVTASRGKIVRAEPIAALYEQNRISHVTEADRPDDLNLLEDQMCQMANDGYVGEGSPDRVDGLVWALSALMLAKPATLSSGAMRGAF